VSSPRAPGAISKQAPFRYPRRRNETSTISNLASAIDKYEAALSGVRKPGARPEPCAVLELVCGAK
jgi:hypothetical protein